MGVEQSGFEALVSLTKEALIDESRRMGVNFRRLSLARDIPGRGSEYVQNVVEHLRDMNFMRPEEVMVAPCTTEYFDEETGLQVVPESVGGTRVDHPDSFDIRFRVPPKDGQTTLGAAKQWMARHFGEEAAANLQADYDREHNTHYFSGSTGPIRLEILRRAFRDEYRNHEVDMQLPQLQVGPIHYSFYDGPHEDTGLHGHTYPLMGEKLNMFAGVLERAVSHLVKLDEVDVAALADGVEQKFTYRASLERERQQELGSIINSMIEIEPTQPTFNDPKEAEYEYADVTDAVQARAKATEEFIRDRARVTPKYRPTTYHAYVEGLNGRHSWAPKELKSYGRDPEQAAQAMARHDAEIITAGNPSLPISTADLDRLHQMWGDTLAENHAHNVIALGGIDPDRDQYRTSGRYVKGSRKHALSTDSIKGSKWTRLHVDAYVNNNGVVKRVRQKPGAPQSWEPVISEHVFLPKNQAQAASLVQTLADKQGEREYESFWAPRHRQENIRRAQALINIANTPSKPKP